MGGTTGASTVLGFWVTTCDAVDEIYTDLTGAGHRGHQPLYDAFWGGRYAIVDDPDGNSVGIMSPQDRTESSGHPASRHEHPDNHTGGPGSDGTS